METKEYLQRLIEISSKKLSLMDEIMMFTKTQNEVIKDKRFEEVDLLIKERQKRMDAVDKFDEQFVVYSSRLKEMAGVTSFEELPNDEFPGLPELKGIVESIHERIIQLKELDDENTNLVKIEMQNTRNDITNTNAHKRATGAYYPPSNTTSYYFDKKK